MKHHTPCAAFHVFLTLISIPCYYVQGQGQGAVRLYNNGVTSADYTADSVSGIVQVYYNSVWSNICVLNSSDISAQFASEIICYQLGFRTGNFLANNTRFGRDSSPPAIITSCDLYDYPWPSNILQCRNSKPTADCSAKNDMAVLCSSNIFHRPLRNIDVALVGQMKFTGSGLVLTKCNYTWGKVCYDKFTQNDADIVCRDIGYTNAINISRDYGKKFSSYPIWINAPNRCDQKDITYDCFGSCRQCPSTHDHLPSCPDNTFVSVTCNYKEGLPRRVAGGCSISNNTSNDIGINIGAAVGVGIALVAICCMAIVIPIAICTCCCFKKQLGYKKI